MSSPTAQTDAYKHWSYATQPEFLDTVDRIKLAYERARAVAEAWGLSEDDIDTCSPRFWAMQREGVLPLDAGTTNILACHVNLFLGTIIPLLKRRPDLQSVVEKGLKCDFFGNLLLTEVGHGLDITGMETTATKVADGFVLHTPCADAAKFIPPTTAIPGYTKMAIVFARLIVDGEYRGMHPFLVTICTEKGVCEGVRTNPLPPRSGSAPLDFAITTFHDVFLPHGSFLGESLQRPKDPKQLLHKYLWRITVGMMGIPLTVSTILKFVTVIGSDFSYRRHVQGHALTKVPVISFRTQQIPVLYATAAAHVIDAWCPRAVEQFMSYCDSPLVQRGFGVVFKATVLRLTSLLARLVGERLGAQGTFGHNLLSQVEMDVRGGSIAEGDILVTSIRLFSELLIGRYEIPSPAHPDTLLSRHSADIFARCRQMLSTLDGGHRDDAYNRLIVPQCELGVTALGQAYAYSCALDANVPKPLLDLFECLIITLDPMWYTEKAGITDIAFRRLEDKAIEAALPYLPAYVDKLNVRHMVSAPVISDKKWKEWVALLPVETGAEPQIQDLYNLQRPLGRLSRL